MARLSLLGAILLMLAACPSPSMDVDAGTEHCLDRPDQMTRAPNGQLPCELLPPGFQR